VTNVLRQVLTGRDEQPAWRSDRGRRLAYAVAWAGWALLALSALAAVTVGLRDHGWQGGPGAAGLPHAGGPGGGPGYLLWLAIELAVYVAVPLLPRSPLLGWRVAYLGVLLAPLIGDQNRVDTSYYIILVVAFVVAGLRYGPPRLWCMAVLMLVPVWLWTPPLLRGAEGSGFPLSPARAPDWAYPVRLTIGLAVLTILLYAAGRWRRDRAALATQAREARRQAQEAQRQAEEAQRQAQEAQRNAEEARQQRERGAVLEERARMAREMHDVVAHHMSMIAVQAETAPYRVAGLPEGALAEFAALSASAREALTDMRRLLGVLRSAGEAGSDRVPDLLPQPGLADVDNLVDSARRAGADVAFEMSVAEGEVPAIMGLTAYRIVQECLSNAHRHAPGAPITVAVRQGPRLVLLEVDNGPARLPPAAAVPAGGGHGLAGMRERVALLGGRLSAGPRADGGFAVRAEVPVAPPLDSTVIRARIADGGWHQPAEVPVSGDPA
jgi:signal transduction histidine kinase